MKTKYILKTEDENSPKFVTLEQLTLMKGGVKALQGAYDKAKKEDGDILNDLSKLKALGIKV